MDIKSLLEVERATLPIWSGFVVQQIAKWTDPKDSLSLGSERRWRDMGGEAKEKE